ncbi:hypothetical protein [Cryobacterium sp. Y50]|uniref:hypothetical protein n=1 Tax=Cryobacterium sp. Y50 TaxID=2048286 RepID=UPI0011B0EC7E|nr:hypothetical protein [Cryobacterium sp. Y50]
MFILAEKASIPIEWMGRKLKVLRASFYRSLRPVVQKPTRVRHTVLAAREDYVSHIVRHVMPSTAQ